MILNPKRDKEGEGMDSARKKIRICLVCVVTAAVIVGLLYYFNDVRGNTDINEGTLVRTVQDAGVPESRG